mgnify:CR=1 FL=1
MQNPQSQTVPEPKRLDWTTMVVPFLLIIILCLCFLAAPDASKAVLENLRGFLGENFGVGYLAIGLGIFLLSIYIAFSRYGTIRLGKPDATDDEVVAAAKAACCHEFIVKLENGYDTNAGDAGGKLSGGERQRITIARAILKNARVIILDEATAYADPENEYLIQNAISKLVKGKTLIVVAHRLATIQKADQILVVENGKIVGCGRQEELLSECPLYQRLWSDYVSSADQVEGGTF